MAEEHTIKYPECEKIRELRPKAQIIGDFLSALGNHGLVLCERGADDMGEVLPTTLNIEQIIAKHLGIDLQKAEAERVQMLEELQNES